MKIKAAGVLSRRGRRSLCKSSSSASYGWTRVPAQVCGRQASLVRRTLDCRDQWLLMPLPAVLGDEGAGIGAAVGLEVTEVEVGDRVGMSFNSLRPLDLQVRLLFIRRRHLRPQLRGSQAGRHHCPLRTVWLSTPDFFGCSKFATYAVATERNVTVLPEVISLDIAAPLWMRCVDWRWKVRSMRSAHGRVDAAVLGTGGVGVAVMAGVIAARPSSASTSSRKPARARARLARHMSSMRASGTSSRRSSGSRVRRRLRARDDGLRGRFSARRSNSTALQVRQASSERLRGC